MHCMVWIQALLLVLSASPSAVARRDGAPSDACLNMEPYHNGIKGQPMPGPYNLTMSKQIYSSSEFINVTIEAPEDRPFKGFLLQAWNLNTNKPFGEFIVTDGVQAVCGYRMGLTHTNSELKNSTTFTWKAPSDGTDKVVFRVTIVENFINFWVDMRSEILLPAVTTGSTPTETTTSATATTQTEDVRTDGLNTTPNTTTNFTTTTTLEEVPPNNTTPKTAAATSEDYPLSFTSFNMTKSESRIPEMMNSTVSDTPLAISTTSVMSTQFSVTGKTEPLTTQMSSRLLNNTTDGDSELLTTSLPDKTTGDTHAVSISHSAPLDTIVTTTDDVLRSEGESDAGSADANATNERNLKLSLWLPLGLVLCWTCVIIAGATVRYFRTRRKPAEPVISSSYYSAYYATVKV